MAARAELRMDARSWALLLVLSILWGGSFYFVEVALEAIPPFTLVFARVALAALALHVVLRAGGQAIPTDRRTLALLVLLGLLSNAVPFLLIVFAQTEIAAGLASILIATTPVFTALLAHVSTADERLTTAKAVGIGLGLAGVVAMIGPGALRGFGAHGLAELACLGASLCYAFSSLIARRLKNVSPLATSAGQLTVSSLALAPLALLVDRPWALPVPGLAPLAAFLALALASTAFAYLLYFRVLARAGATNANLVTLLTPPTAILLGAIALGERLGAEAYGGLALIAAGLLAIDGRVLALARRRAPVRG